MLLLRKAVGTKAPNEPGDVSAVHKLLMDIGKIRCYPCRGMDDEIQNGILSAQRHFLIRPDGIIDVNGTTHKFLNVWKEKPVSADVRFMGRLKEAWDWLNPILPEGSYCSSAYRSADDQRRILHRFFTVRYKLEIVAKYGQKRYNEVLANLNGRENDVLDLVRGVGQAIAAPGKSAHQKGKAVDIGGPSNLDGEQVRIVKLVAKAHPDLFSGKVLKERNGCVHFEIL